jgi:hypothetical protein
LPIVTILSHMKNEKAKIERTRTIARIHLSFDAARKIGREFVEKHPDDYDSVTSNGSTTLLGCELEVHMHQVDDFIFEDTNGRKIHVGTWVGYP